MPHETEGVFQAVELFRRFRRQARKAPTKGVSADILDARLVLSRGPNLDTMRAGKVLSVAPFATTCVSFWTEPMYKGHPMTQTLGWRLGAVLWNEEEQSMRLFALLKDGEIALVPKSATKKLEKGIGYFLAHCWAQIITRNPTSDWWGGEKPGSRKGTKHYFTKSPDKAPPAFAIYGTYKNEMTWADFGQERYATHSTDVRQCLACYVERGRGNISAATLESLERRGYTIWGAGELVDDQAGRLIAERGIKSKAPGEWLAVKMVRRGNYLRGQGKYVPITRLSDA